MVNLLDPEAVLLGGYFAPLTQWLREPIEAELETGALANAHAARCSRRSWAARPRCAGR